MNLAKILPYPIKQALKYIYISIPLQFRYSKTFWDTYNLLQESQWWSKERLEAYQMQQLSKLLHHSYENVPYYRRIFNERGLKPEDITSKEDLLKLPLLTKDIIRNNFKDLIAKNIHRRDLLSVKTSGSTMSPLSFFWDKNITDLKEKAFIWTIYNIAGYQFGEKRLDLTWERLNNRFCQYDPLERCMKITASTFSVDIFHSYIKLIHEFKPKVLKSIPSTLVVLADFINKNRIAITPPIKVILCSSEQIYPWQRELIERAFQCRLFTFYGQSERVILGTECAISNHYHIFSEYGITEIIGSDGYPLKSEESKGRLIGTGFNNYAMPFIRYDVDDIAVLSNKKCTCGRNYPLLQLIEGRENEYIVSHSGELIPIISISYSHIMKNVKQFQFYQDVKGEVILRLVSLPSFTKYDAENIISNLRQELKDIKIKLEYTDIIKRNENGKFNYIIQNIPIKFGINHTQMKSQMSKIKILFIGPVPPEVGGQDAGGVATLCWNLATHAKNSGYEVSVLSNTTYSFMKDGITLLSRHNIKNKLLKGISGLYSFLMNRDKLSSLNFLSFKDKVVISYQSNYLKKVLKELNPDLIHVLHILDDTVFSLTILNEQSPIILTEHGVGILCKNEMFKMFGIHRERCLRERIDAITKRVHYIHSVSEFSKRHFLNICNYSSAVKVKAILNPINTHNLPLLNKEEIKDNLKLKGKKIVFFCGPSKSIERKGLDILLNAFSIDDVLRENCTLIIVTGREAADTACNIIRSKKIDGKVLYSLPWQQLVQYYNASDIFVMPSRQEGIGLAYYESLLAGVPIVGFSESIDELQNQLGIYIGEKYDPYSENETDLAKKIKKVLSIEFDRELLRNRVIEKLSWDVKFCEFDAVYKELLADK
jgi:phenylacetate-CoA ligase